MERDMPEDMHSHMKMVVIDDDEMVLNQLKLTLTDFGFTVYPFVSARAAIDWIKQNGVDIVITDVGMPECDGFEVLKQVKELDPQCDVILLTGQKEMELVIKALRQGAADYFIKPFDAIELRAAIERTSRFRMLTQQRNLLQTRVVGLSRELDYRKTRTNVMIGRSGVMRDLTRRIVDLADFQTTVLITGESGTGKELIANAIHLAGPRKQKPMLSINCASVPDNLFESEMFGHVKGAFTGAIDNKIGYVAAAEGGILFLDEIGDLPLILQGKILRLLEQKTYLPVGGVKERMCDVRLIAATNRDLEDLVREDRFRQDLFYRLSASTISVPPLRERRDDIPLLATHLGIQCSMEAGRKFAGIEDNAINALMAYDYPGNVRELRNIIESGIIHSRNHGKLQLADLPDKLKSASPSAAQYAPSNRVSENWPLDTLKLVNVEAMLYKEALRRTGGNVSAAAEMVGLSRGKFRHRMDALGMNRAN